MEPIIRLLALAEEVKNPDELLRGFESTLTLYDFDSYLLLRHAGASDAASGLMAGKISTGDHPSPEFLPDAVLWRLRTDIGGFRIRDALLEAVSGRKRRSRKTISNAAVTQPWSDGYAFPIHTGRGFAGSVALRGERVLSALELRLFEAIARMLFWRLARSRDGQAVPAAIAVTQRESEVLSFLADGMTSHEIGQTLKISTHTVDWYMNGLQEKFSARNRPHLLALAFRLGLLG